MYQLLQHAIVTNTSQTQQRGLAPEPGERGVSMPWRTERMQRVFSLPGR